MAMTNIIDRLNKLTEENGQLKADNKLLKALSGIEKIIV